MVVRIALLWHLTTACLFCLGPSNIVWFWVRMLHKHFLTQLCVGSFYELETLTSKFPIHDLKWFHLDMSLFLSKHCIECSRRMQRKQQPNANAQAALESRNFFKSSTVNGIRSYFLKYQRKFNVRNILRSIALDKSLRLHFPRPRTYSVVSLEYC